jgi:hypothetical protein
VKIAITFDLAHFLPGNPLPPTLALQLCKRKRKLIKMHDMNLVLRKYLTKSNSGTCFKITAPSASEVSRSRVKERYSVPHRRRLWRPEQWVWRLGMGSCHSLSQMLVTHHGWLLEFTVELVLRGPRSCFRKSTQKYSGVMRHQVSHCSHMVEGKRICPVIPAFLEVCGYFTN